MFVEVHDLAPDGQDRIAGILRLRGGAVAAEPATKLLRSILAEPVYDPRGGGVWDAEQDPEKFLDALRFQYTSAYLRASKPIDDESEDEGDDGASLARHYADLWNTMREHGEDVPDEHLHEPSEELSRTPWRVTRLPDRSWVAHRHDDVASLRGRRHLWLKGYEPAVTKEAQHAPKGGIFLINMKGEGHFYVGGQWIPAKEIANLPPAEKAKLQQSLGQAQHQAKMERVQRGDVNPEQLREHLKPIARPLDAKGQQRAVNELRALHGYHGDLTLHRIEQLAKQQVGFLKRANLTEKQREQIRGNLSRLHAMVDLAKAWGVTGKVPARLRQLAQRSGKPPPKPAGQRPQPADYPRSTPAKESAKPEHSKKPAPSSAPMTPEDAAKALAKQAGHVAQPKEGADAASALNRELIEEGKKPKEEAKTEPVETSKKPDERQSFRARIQQHAEAGGRFAIEDKGKLTPVTVGPGGFYVEDESGRKLPTSMFLNDPHAKLRFEPPAEKKEAPPEPVEKPAEPSKPDAKAPEREPGDEPEEEELEEKPAAHEEEETASRHTPRAGLTHRQALAQSEKDTRKDWSDKALLAGIKPKDLHAMAEGIIEDDKAWSEQRRGLLARARELLDHYGYHAGALTTNLRSGRVEDEVPGLDVVADSLQRSYPEQFAGDEDNPAQRLMEMFEEGVPQPISKDAAYERAFDYLQEQKDNGGEASGKPLWGEEEEDDPFASQWKSYRRWWVEKARRRQDAPGQTHLWNADEHPRAPKGGEHGGEFAKKGQVDAALERHANHKPADNDGGLFAGDLEARRGFAKLPDGAAIVFTHGEFHGQTGKIVHDKDALTGAPRIVASVDGREGLVPIAPDAIEPLGEHHSWRVAGGGSGAGTEQGGLYTADQFLPKRAKEEGKQESDVASEEPKKNPVEAFQDFMADAAAKVGDGETDPVQLVDSFYEQTEKTRERLASHVSDLIDHMRKTQGERLDGESRKEAEKHFKEFDDYVRQLESDLDGQLEDSGTAFDELVSATGNDDDFSDEEVSDLWSAFEESQEKLERERAWFSQQSEAAIKDLVFAIDDEIEMQNTAQEEDAQGSADLLNSEMYEEDPEGAVEDAGIHNRELEEVGNPHRVYQNDEGEWYIGFPEDEEDRNAQTR